MCLLVEPELHVANISKSNHPNTIPTLRHFQPLDHSLGVRHELQELVFLCRSVNQECNVQWSSATASKVKVEMIFSSFTDIQIGFLRSTEHPRLY